MKYFLLSRCKWKRWYINQRLPISIFSRCLWHEVVATFLWFLTNSTSFFIVDVENHQETRKREFSAAEEMWKFRCNTYWAGWWGIYYELCILRWRIARFITHAYFLFCFIPMHSDDLKVTDCKCILMTHNCTSAMWIGRTCDTFSSRQENLSEHLWYFLSWLYI